MTARGDLFTNKNRLTCNGCIWCDKCNSDQPCEDYDNGGDTETGLYIDEEYIHNSKEEFYRDWDKYVSEDDKKDDYIEPIYAFDYEIKNEIYNI